MLHATPFEIGALSAVEMAPFLLVGLPAGVWVDRMRRRPILIAGDLGRAVVLGSVPVAYALDRLTMGQLYVVAFTSGVLTVFFDVAYMAYLPSLVERDQIVEGNSKLTVSRSGAELAGPGLAGLLVGAIKAPPAIAVDGLSYLASAWFVFRIRAPEPVPERRTAGSPRMRAEIAEGLRYVLGHPYLRPIAACTAMFNLFGSMGYSILVLYEVRRLGLSAGTIGVVFTLGNVGLVVGALGATRAARRIGIGPATIVSTLVSGAAMILVPVAPRSGPIPFLVVAQFLGSVGAVVYNINQVSLRQVLTPERLQGRMNATMRFFVWGTMPIGSLLGGTLGGWIGLRATLVVGALGTTLPFVFPLLSQVRTLREMPEAATATPAD